MPLSCARRRPRLFPAKLILSKDEDKRAYHRLRIEVLHEWRPEPGEQSHLVERLILGLWNLRRVAEAEGRVMAADTLEASTLAILGRFRRATLREVDGATKQLRALQAMKGKSDETN